jgi:beta-glucosidase
MAPLFPFGHGLSYTTFRYSNLRISPGRIKAYGHVKVRVDVRNSGKVKGKEVVQLYVNDVVSSVTTPVKTLRGFEKVELEPGQKVTVEFDLGSEDLKLLDLDMNWVVEPGQFEVLVDTLKKTFEVVQ